MASISTLKVITLDDTHLRGKYKGSLLTATIMDSSHEIILLAYSVAESESRDSWSWFCSQLRLALDSVNAQVIFFVADREKGLLDSIREFFPLCGSIHCLRHIAGNIRNKFKEENYVSKFYNFANSSSESEFDAVFENIEDENFQRYISGMERTAWIFFARTRPSYGHHNSNMAESMNSMLSSIRNLPILSMCVEIQTLTMSAFFERITKSAQFVGLTNFAQKVIREGIKSARRFEVRPSSNTVGLIMEYEKDYIVDIGNRKCSCLNFRNSLIPYPHAIAFCLRVNKEPMEICDSVYKWETYRKVYENEIPSAAKTTLN